MVEKAQHSKDLFQMHHVTEDKTKPREFSDIPNIAIRKIAMNPGFFVFIFLLYQSPTFSFCFKLTTDLKCEREATKSTHFYTTKLFVITFIVTPKFYTHYLAKRNVQRIS